MPISIASEKTIHRRSKADPLLSNIFCLFPIRRFPILPICYTFAMPTRVARSQDLPVRKHFKASFSELWRGEIGGWAIRLSLILFVFLVFLIIVSAWRLPPEIPLLYSRPWGNAQLLPASFLFLVAGLVVLLVSLNGFLSGVFFPVEPLLARIVAWAGVLTIFLVDITVLRVLLIVI